MAKGMPHARERAQKPPKELDHIRLYKGENGGAVVEHHFTSYEHPAEKLPFGAEDGPKLHAHIDKMMGVDAGQDLDD